MDKILFFLFFILPTTAIAQVTLNFGLGALKSRRTHPVFKLSVQGEVHHFILEAAEYPVMKREVNPGSYIGFSGGYRIWKFIPSVGYLFNLRSSDAKGKDVNGWRWKAGLKFYQRVNYNAGWYVEALYVDRMAGLNAGIAYTF